MNANKNKENSQAIMTMAEEQIDYYKMRDEVLHMEINQMEEEIKAKKEEIKDNSKMVTVYRHLSEEAVK